MDKLILSIADIKRVVWIGPEPMHSTNLVIDTVIPADKITDVIDYADLFIIACNEQQDKLLSHLRQCDQTALSLILVTESSPLSRYLANGLFKNSYDEKLEYYLKQLNLAKLHSDGNIEFKLLNYLWRHEGTSLEPMCVPSQNWQCHYPLLSLWGIPSNEHTSWLTKLAEKGWLEAGELLWRVRYSNCCESGHLNYIDLCPNCNSVDITKENCLHCFTCGHIETEHAFRKNGQLFCPNCNQTLRHIGVDYDRPIENQRCKHCASIFVDANVKAQCLECGQLLELDFLKVKEFYNYKLSLAGKLLVRQGAISNLFDNQTGRQVSLEQFCWLVDWQSKLAKRYNQQHTILSIELTNLEILTKKSFAGLSLDVLNERICSIIRSVDICTRYTELGLLILMPFININRISSVVNRFRDLGDSFVEPLNFNFRTVFLPASVTENIKDWLFEQFSHAEPL